MPCCSQLPTCGFWSVTSPVLICIPLLQLGMWLTVVLPVCDDLKGHRTVLQYERSAQWSGFMQHLRVCAEVMSATHDVAG